jgi:hypothetical protein
MKKPRGRKSRVRVPLTIPNNQNYLRRTGYYWYLIVSNLSDSRATRYSLYFTVYAEKCRSHTLFSFWQVAERKKNNNFEKIRCPQKEKKQM